MGRGNPVAASSDLNGIPSDRKLLLLNSVFEKYFNDDSFLEDLIGKITWEIFQVKDIFTGHIFHEKHHQACNAVLRLAEALLQRMIFQRKSLSKAQSSLMEFHT